jgi:hypothetical protein
MTSHILSLRILRLSLLGSRNFYSLLSAQHLTQLIRYFTMLPVREIKVPLSRKPFEITTRGNQLHCLKEAIEYQHGDQEEQSDLTKWFTMTTSDTSHASLQLPSYGEASSST